MSGSNKEAVTGSKLEYSTDDGANWLKIAGAKVAAVPQEEPSYEDVTDLDSGGVNEFIETLSDPGSIDFEANYTDDAYVALSGLKGVATDFKSTFAGGASVQYKGFLRVTINNDDVTAARKMTVKVKCSGTSTYTAGA